MPTLDDELRKRLAALRDQGLHRELRRLDSAQSPRVEFAGRTLLNFSSNDYLGLANDPVLKQAAIAAVQRYGAGAGASRLVSGSLSPHHELDEAIAAFKGAESALSFSSGYTAAVGVICALLSREDILLSDKLVHASIVDAARLSGAKLRIFAHNDLSELETALQWADACAQSSTADAHRPRSRVLIVTESVFSMDGDHAPLGEIVELKDKYGAWLMVDEAHATGLYGPHRRGLAEELGVSERVEIQMGTLGKALGASGGYICGSRALTSFLVNRARSFIFSTSPVPAAAAAATAGIRFVQSSEGQERRALLWRLATRLGLEIGIQSTARPCAILPILIGDEIKAVEAAAALREEGIFIPAIRYPSVGRGQARLRLTVTAAHTQADLSQLSAVLAKLDLLPKAPGVSR